MTNITRHPLIQQAYDVCQAIEACGASVELTNAVTKASDLMRAIDKFIPVQRPDYQLRVIGEKLQLDGRIEPLAAFFDTDIYKSLDAAEQERLTTQLGAMREYSAILGERIKAFGGEA